MNASISNDYKNTNKAAIFAEPYYSVQRPVSYTHLTLPTICSV